MKKQTPCRRSLAGRLVLALLLAFALVAVVLLANDYRHLCAEFSETSESALTRETARLGRMFERIDSTHDALIIVQAIQDHSQQARREEGIAGGLLLELWDARGSRLYASPALGASRLLGPPSGQAVQHIEGARYRVTQSTTPRWRLVMAEPYLGDAAMLGFLWRNLAPSLLLAFPFVMLPVWLAVRQGLQPLRRLAEVLPSRAADDLTPLELDLRYVELQPLIRAFNDLLARLRAKVERERAFVQDAAHELRTPMAVIATQAHVLSRAVSEAERGQARDALEQAIERASHLARQLLALATLDQNRAPQCRHVDLAHLLQNWLAQAIPLAEQRGIDVALEAPDTLPADIDVAAFQSIVGNLLDNALRYGRQAGQVAIQLQAAGSGAGFVLRVADDGPGIPLHERATIFDRFVRGSGQQAEGSGLGLAIVIQAVRCLDGRIHITDGLRGLGVGFEVWWPAARAAA